MGKVFGTLTSPDYLIREPDSKESKLRLLRGSDAQILGRADDQASQFRLLNLEQDPDGNPIFIDPHESEAKLAGSDSQPDVRARIELIAFNAGPTTSEKIDKATLRLDIGQDPLSQSPLQPLFWSVAAGLDLAELIAGKREAPQKYRSDFQRAFGSRPVEIGGGLSRLRFEVVAHRPKPWWRDIFSFTTSATGRALVHVLGFPGIVNEAVALIDSAFDQLGDGSQEILFRSPPMTLALSNYARQEFTLGVPGVEIGVLNSGFSLLLPQKHFQSVTALRPKFWATYGRLIPQDVTLAEFVDPSYQDPFAAIPYAVIRTKTESAALSSSL